MGRIMVVVTIRESLSAIFVLEKMHKCQGEEMLIYMVEKM